MVKRNKYKAIFLDIDDTILNFPKSSEGAFKDTFKHFNLDFTEDLYKVYLEINDDLWKQQKEEKITVNDVINTRFSILSEKLNLGVEPNLIRDHFQAGLGCQHFLEVNADLAIKELAKSYKVYAASNSELSMQENRLKLAGLYEYFTDLYISSDIGYEKPNVNFFEESLQRAQLSPNEVLMVGDSLISDMYGAYNARIDRCWYNPYKLEKSHEVPLNYEVNDLKELLEFL
ncbi:YjjG family noncanonical pyrimidine nucleotidase [Jeotgalicoccus sp. ATCC 8456]|uniref:YjjG family noncanonical pyrimidine nucleotidase n=1 Tax=Jeotgalicoccus sp. ATCC 8456 TaxID=946435 RepID=UPI0018E60318|nr:YjjG family noncanonical pyrimidine nucleotidase [Jeotgalicoccus sp. ATCC 8456]QQD84246.1 YjjG family noncanonical pyrimidine nucleotidase [Jeotgalicoccus sp. ATCC 8456]